MQKTRVDKLHRQVEERTSTHNKNPRTGPHRLSRCAVRVDAFASVQTRAPRSMKRVIVELKYMILAMLCCIRT